MVPMYSHSQFRIITREPFATISNRLYKFIRYKIIISDLESGQKNQLTTQLEHYVKKFPSNLNSFCVRVWIWLTCATKSAIDSIASYLHTNAAA